jgi:hypothetical protein
MAQTMSHRDHAKSTLARAVWAARIILACSLPLGAQEAARTGLAYFPADTQQIAYSNFAQLRASADYPQIRRHVLYQQLHGFQEFLHSLGINPEKDVDEVMLGWRGDSPSGPGSFGVAAGRFEPDKVSEYFAKTQLPVRSYDGCDLYAFGSGADQDDTFFTFLDSTLAAFGRLHDLKALLDVREGYAPPLGANQVLAAYEAELDGTSPQWGILTGRAAANVATPWLAGGKKTSVDLTAFMQPILAVLYRIDWDGGFAAHISVVCKSPETAAGLFQLLNLLKSAPVFAGAAGASAPSPIVQNLDARQEGARLELSASGPAEALDQLIH